MPRPTDDYAALEFGGVSKRPGRPRRTLPLKWAVLVLALLALAFVGGPYLFFHVIEGSSPSPLRLPPAAGVGTGPVVPGPVSGTWTVAAGSEAGYRVQEVLFDQHHTAVGRTSRVSGGLVISGTEVTAADFTVDLATVKSDQVSRDVQFDGYIMETYKHPNASFHLTEPIQLGATPGPGTTVQVQATGDLTLRGTTQTVTFPVRAERVAGGIDVNAQIPITFSRWHIPNPSFAVAQVGSTGTVEVLLHLAPDQVSSK